jgi:hypothetical protein
LMAMLLQPQPTLLWHQPTLYQTSLDGYSFWILDLLLQATINVMLSTVRNSHAYTIMTVMILWMNRRWKMYPKNKGIWSVSLGLARWEGNNVMEQTVQDEDQGPSKEWGPLGWYSHRTAQDIARGSDGGNPHISCFVPIWVLIGVMKLQDKFVEIICWSCA